VIERVLALRGHSAEQLTPATQVAEGSQSYA
jgi:hypothetical protein